MGLLDELKRLTKPYDEDDDYLEEDLEEPVRAPQRQPNPRSYGYQEPPRPAEVPPQYRQPQYQQPQYQQPQYQQPQYRQPQPQRRSAYAVSQPPASQGYPAQGNVMPFGQPGPAPAARMLLYKPDRFDAAVEIAERLQERNAVVLNLESAPKDVARRLVDFLTGVAFALNGQVKKVSGNTCVITPAGMDVMGEGADDMESRENYF